MAYENEKQTQDPVQDEKQRPEEQFVPEGASFSLPNSIMMAMPVAPPPGTPNSVMREMLDEQNEAEGSFSEGPVFGSVNSVLRRRSLSEGGNLLGGGSLFGGGLSSLAGGHELSHVVRRAPAPALVSRSVPFNTIQRDNTVVNGAGGQKKENGNNNPGNPAPVPGAGSGDTDELLAQIENLQTTSEQLFGNFHISSRRKSLSGQSIIKEARDTVETAKGGIRSFLGRFTGKKNNTTSKTKPETKPEPIPADSTAAAAVEEEEKLPTAVTDVEPHDTGDKPEDTVTNPSAIPATTSADPLATEAEPSEVPAELKAEEKNPESGASASPAVTTNVVDPFTAPRGADPFASEKADSMRALKPRQPKDEKKPKPKKNPLSSVPISEPAAAPTTTTTSTKAAAELEAAAETGVKPTAEPKKDSLSPAPVPEAAAAATAELEATAGTGVKPTTEPKKEEHGERRSEMSDEARQMLNNLTARISAAWELKPRFKFGWQLEALEYSIIHDRDSESKKERVAFLDRLRTYDDELNRIDEDGRKKANEVQDLDALARDFAEKHSRIDTIIADLNALNNAGLKKLTSEQKNELPSRQRNRPEDGAEPAGSAEPQAAATATTTTSSAVSDNSRENRRSAPIQGPLTRDAVKNDIGQLLSDLMLQKELLSRTKKSYANDLKPVQSRIANGNEKMKTLMGLSKTDPDKQPDKLMQTAFGQVEDGFDKLFGNLTKIKMSFDSAETLSDDDLKQYRWEVQQIRWQMEDLKNLEQQKKDELKEGEDPDNPGAKTESEFEKKLKAVSDEIRDIDTKELFGEEGDRRWRMSVHHLTEDQMDKMAKLYKAYCILNGRDLGEKVNGTDPENVDDPAIVSGFEEVEQNVGEQLADKEEQKDGKEAAPAAPVAEATEAAAAPKPTTVPEAPVTDVKPTVPVEKSTESVAAAEPTTVPEAPVVTETGAPVVTNPEALTTVPETPVTDVKPTVPVEKATEAAAAAEPTTVPKNTIMKEPLTPTVASSPQPTDLKKNTAMRELSDTIQRVSKPEVGEGAAAASGSGQPEAAAAAPAGGAAPVASGPRVITGREYNAPGEKTLKHWNPGKVGLGQGIFSSANSWTKFGLLMDHDRNHGYDFDNNSEDDYDRWDLKHSRGDYSPYTDWASPIIDTGLSGFGAIASSINANRARKDLKRKEANLAVGENKTEVLQSKLKFGTNVFSAAQSSFSAALSGAKLVNNIGMSAGWWTKWSDYGKFLKGWGGVQGKVMPWLSLGKGVADVASGSIQIHQARKTKKGLKEAEAEMKNERVKGAQPEAPAPPGRRSDQQKLQDIMETGRKTANLNIGSGWFKIGSAAFSAAGTISSMAGAAPVSAGIKGASVLLSIAKTSFEYGYKKNIRKTAVAKEYNIDWDKEIDDVRTMVHLFNSKFNMRDHYVREVILKAHGSGKLRTRSEAFKQIKLDRARFLIRVANDPGHKYHKTAGLVIEALGVERKGPENSFVKGAEGVLAEKLGY